MRQFGTLMEVAQIFWAGEGRGRFVLVTAAATCLNG